MNVINSDLEVERDRHTGEVSVNTHLGSWLVEPRKWQILLQEAKIWRESAERRRQAPEGYKGPVVHERDAAMGAKIWSTILPIKGVRGAFLREMEESNAPLRFSVLGQDREIISMPWEACSHPDRQILDVDPEDTQFHRTSNLVVLRAPVPPRWDHHDLEEPIEILAVASTPKELLPPNYDFEEKIIEQSLDLQIREDRCHIVTLDHLNKQDLEALVQKDKPHVLHIMAHGEDGKLLAQDTRSNLVRLDGRQIAAIMKDVNGPEGSRKRLVLFVSTACELMRDASDAFSLEVGPALADFIPFSIGMQLPVSPNVAQLFSQEFYASVGGSKSIVDSYLHARGELLSRYPGSSSWVAPVLYIASYQDYVLFEVDDALYRLKKIAKGFEEPIKALSVDVEDGDALKRVLSVLLALDEFHEYYKNSPTRRLNISSRLTKLVKFADKQARTNLLYLKKYVETENDEWFFDKGIPERSVALKRALNMIRDEINELCNSLREPPSRF